MNVLISLLLFAMSDANALIEARALLGPTARTYKVAGARANGLLEYRIACEIPGKDPIVPGVGISWESALKSIDPKRNGKHYLSVKWIDGAIHWFYDAVQFAIGPDATLDTTKGGVPTGEGTMVFACNP